MGTDRCVHAATGGARAHAILRHLGTKKPVPIENWSPTLSAMTNEQPRARRAGPLAISSPYWEAYAYGTVLKKALRAASRRARTARISNAATEPARPLPALPLAGLPC